MGKIIQLLNMHYKTSKLLFTFANYIFLPDPNSLCTRRILFSLLLLLLLLLLKHHRQTLTTWHVGVFVDRGDALWFASVVSFYIKFELELSPNSVFSQVMVLFNEVLINNKLVALPQKISWWSYFKTSSPHEHFQVVHFPFQTYSSNAPSSLKRQCTLSDWLDFMSATFIQKITYAVYVNQRLYFSYFRKSRHYLEVVGDNIVRQLISRFTSCKSRYWLYKTNKLLQCKYQTMTTVNWLATLHRLGREIVTVCCVKMFLQTKNSVRSLMKITQPSHWRGIKFW